MEDAHVFTGMRRDNHPIKQPKEYLWDARNIRLTTRDGDTMLSITNEKGTKVIFQYSKEAFYVGHVVLGDWIVLFLVEVEETGLDPKLIGSIRRVNPEEGIDELLYIGEDLNFDYSNPIQAIGDYESELVQKVYWTDGKNPPRVINIAKPELLYPDLLTRRMHYNTDRGYSDLYNDAPFSFVQELKLEEEVTVERLSSSVGSFPAGVVQYALTYCHKYGQESNIFYTSQLLYTSYSDRGGSPEDKISTSFKLKIENVDTKFQYIRVYSIMRTSIDEVPTVKRVADIDITNLADGATIEIVDNNTTGDIVDPTYLLYVGGKDITAGCITSKDNVLFLGDITYNRKSIYGLSSSIFEGNGYKLKGTTINVADNPIQLKGSDESYIYTNQLFTNTSTFKNNETYRLGCRFQYKNGEWSEPVWIDDYVYNKAPIIDKDTLLLGKIVVNIPQSLSLMLSAEGYKKVQALIAKPSEKDRTILAQGIVCPTVGQVGNRIRGGGAWAQSSWLLRPWANSIEGDGYQGAVPSFEHDMSLVFGKERCVELQTMAVMADDSSGFDGGMSSGMYTLSYQEMKDLKKDNTDTEDYYGAFVVDQSIVTMHSPDIEFGDLGNVISSGNELEVYKVGEVKFSSNKGEIDIQTSTPVADPDAGGFVKRSISGSGVRSLISGLFYEDSMVDDANNEGKFQKYMDPKLWMTYMWHRTGSLNNDCARPDGSGVRTSELRKKSITNLKISNETIYSLPSLLNSVDVQNFNSNEVSLTRINRIGESGKIESSVYYGNVDTLISAYTKYSFVLTNSALAELDNPTIKNFTGNVITGGEIKSFGMMTIEDAKGTPNSISSSNITQGIMPYVIEYSNTVTSDSALGSSSTTVTSSGNKTVLVNIAGKASINISFEGSKYTGLVTLLEDVTAEDGKTIVPEGYSWSIYGNTTYAPKVKSYKNTWFGHRHTKWGNAPSSFVSQLEVLADSNSEGMADIGDHIEALKLSKEGVRMKYKSAPHAVISLNSHLTSIGEGRLYLVELRQKINEDLRYGGKTKEALRDNLWIPAGPALDINDRKIEFIWGDTWFQRYEFLKTYPFTFEDQNQVTEIGSFFCETRVNIDGRYDRNRGSTSFALSPVNFNLYNPVYSQLNSFFNTRMMDDDYYKVTNYPSQLMWTLAKNPSAIQDEWTNLHTANSLDLDGANGRLINVCSLNDLLVGFQERGISQILFNSRVQIGASDGVPIEIANSQRVEGTRTYSNVIGCQDKFSMITTPEGIYFIDNDKQQIYLFGGDGSIQNLGLQLGSLYWPRENYSPTNWRFALNHKQTTEFRKNGVRLCYDTKYQDVYFIPGADEGVLRGNNRLALCFNEQLAQFTSLMDYGGSVLFSMNNKLYAISLDNSLRGETGGTLCLWECFAGEYNSFFNVTKPFSFSFISNDNSTYNKVFDTIEMRTDQYNGDTLLGNKYTTRVQEAMPLNYIRVDNEYQDTGTVNFNAATMRKKFRVWRAQIPRNLNTRQRVRNTWAKITLGNNSPGTNLTILHDLSVKYTL